MNYTNLTTPELEFECCSDPRCKMFVGLSDNECEFNKMVMEFLDDIQHNRGISCSIGEIPLLNENGNMVCHPQIEHDYGLHWPELLFGCIFLALLTCFINFLINKRKRF